MPKLTSRPPKYRKHKASGQAVVTLDGRDYYLGPWQSEASQLEYNRLVAEWMQNGRRLPGTGCDLTVTELAAAYWRFAKGYYVKNGRRTDEQASIRVALRFLREMYGHTRVTDFGPLALMAVRQKMVEAKNSRGYINKNVSRLRRAFKWGVEQELVPVAVHQALATVSGLKRGKTEARETVPVAPVSEAVVEGTLPHLPPTVADMVRFQRLTGCRPGEVCLLRPCDLDRTGKVWRYVPASHKTEHTGRQRVILVGPRAQAVVLPSLLRAAEEYCFQPARGRREQYTVDRYRNAIHRGAIRAGVPNWNPNQLRHAAATEIRQRFGLEAAQVTLGHSRADVTQIYAERDMAKAVAVMAELG